MCSYFCFLLLLSSMTRLDSFPCRNVSRCHSRSPPAESVREIERLSLSFVSYWIVLICCEYILVSYLSSLLWLSYRFHVIYLARAGATAARATTTCCDSTATKASGCRGNSNKSGNNDHNMLMMMSFNCSSSAAG